MDTVWAALLGLTLTIVLNLILVAVSDAIGIMMGHRHDIAKDVTRLGLALILLNLAYIVMVAIWVGLKSVPSNLALAASPQIVLARDRRAALTIWLGVALGFGFLGVALTFLKFAHGSPRWVWVAACLALGFAFGLAICIREMAWPLYWLTQGRLALKHELPWSLMGFLDDAHQRGVLRQAGANYQFRHIELQRRLATRKNDI